MIKALHDPVLEGGIAYTAYFNGRLLSGEDLARDQEGHREARRRIGQAIGEGVAFGLEVYETAGDSTRLAPVVTVEPGVAINRKGETLALPSRVDLRLVRSLQPGGAPGGATFRVCDERRPGVFVVGEGVYLLTMACAEAGQGRAPVSGLGNAAAQCNVRAVVEGVQFRLEQPQVAPELLLDRAHLRSRLAAAALGIADRLEGYASPFAPRAVPATLVETLRAAGAVTDCEVPLALLHWNASEGIAFVDMWSVRRRLTPRGADARWASLVGPRRTSEAEATYLQFQEQVDDIVSSGEDASQVAAADRFEFLPPVGILPLQAGARPAFDPLRFFGAMASRDVAYTDGRLLRSLVEESFSHDAVALASGERLQLYLVAENTLAGAAGGAVTPVVVFASPALPYRGVARYGLTRWALGRFAPHVI
jgi:hypothetical protein